MFFVGRFVLGKAKNEKERKKKGEEDFFHWSKFRDDPVVKSKIICASIQAILFFNLIAAPVFVVVAAGDGRGDMGFGFRGFSGGSLFA